MDIIEAVRGRGDRFAKAVMAMDGTAFELGLNEELTVVVGGERHGVWCQSSSTERLQIADWIAWWDKFTEHVVVNRDKVSFDVERTDCSIFMLAKDGQLYGASDVPVSELGNLKNLMALCKAPFEAPRRWSYRYDDLENALRALGAEGRTQTRVPYRCPECILPDDAWEHVHFVDELPQQYTGRSRTIQIGFAVGTSWRHYRYGSMQKWVFFEDLPSAAAFSISGRSSAGSIGTGIYHAASEIRRDKKSKRNYWLLHISQPIDRSSADVVKAVKTWPRGVSTRTNTWYDPAHRRSHEARWPALVGTWMA